MGVAPLAAVAVDNPSGLSPAVGSGTNCPDGFWTIEQQAGFAITEAKARQACMAPNVKAVPPAALDTTPAPESETTGTRKPLWRANPPMAQRRGFFVSRRLAGLGQLPTA